MSFIDIFDIVYYEKQDLIHFITGHYCVCEPMHKQPL